MLLLNSCGDTPEEVEKTVETEEISETSEKQDPIVSRWILKSKNSMDNSDSVDYNNEYSDVILSLEPNGYFTVYDSIKKVENLDSDLRLQVRSKGQWMLDKEILVLKHIIDNTDSVRVEKLHVDKLDESSLVTVTTDKEINSYTKYSK